MEPEWDTISKQKKTKEKKMKDDEGNYDGGKDATCDSGGSPAPQGTPAAGSVLREALRWPGVPHIPSARSPWRKKWSMLLFLLLSLSVVKVDVEFSLAHFFCFFFHFVQYYVATCPFSFTSFHLSFSILFLPLVALILFYVTLFVGLKQLYLSFFPFIQRYLSSFIYSGG